MVQINLDWYSSSLDIPSVCRHGQLEQSLIYDIVYDSVLKNVAYLNCETSSFLKCRIREVKYPSNDVLKHLETYLSM